MERIFFDAHMHAFNLSHPNIGAFIRRFLKKIFYRIVIAALIALNIIGIIFLFLFPEVLKYVLFLPLILLDGLYLYYQLRKKNVMEFINILDQSIGKYFIEIENDILMMADHPSSDGPISIGIEKYEKVALCPLMMSFTNDQNVRQSSKTDKLFNEKRRRGRKHPLAVKSLEEQIQDLFQGIRYYYKHSKYKRLIFYPFLGVTLNESVYDDVSDLKELLDKYFNGFSLENKNIDFLHVNEESSVESYDSKQIYFAGIKVYPPLGFNPWPKDYSEEREKAELLYSTCVKKKIPIITHCGGSGFRTVSKNDYERFATPERWQEVLEHYPKLKICFAHLGTEKGVKKHKWTKKIFELIANPKYPNVYTDISCRCFSEKDYCKLNKIVKKHAKKTDLDESDYYAHILFGTDYPMNVITNGSYINYLKGFSNAKFDSSIKRAMCECNPRKFLFEEHLEKDNCR